MFHLVSEDDFKAEFAGPDLTALDGLSDLDLSQECEERHDDALRRGLDPHDDASYLRALVIEVHRKASRSNPFATA